jgi:DNA-binding XRE family transcriptional regulator
MKHDLLHIQGKPYVLVPLHQYRELVTGTSVPTEDPLPSDVLDALTARQESPLRILRRHRGLTQQQLAEAAGLSRPYLTEMEKGSKPGSLRALRAVAKSLDVDISYLAG